MTTELTLPQFINTANIPELSSRFVTILRQWPNYANVGHFRFNPGLYRQIYPELANMSDMELCRYYYREGIRHKPLCSLSALAKLVPSLINNNPITHEQMIDDIHKTFFRPMWDLLSRYVSARHENMTKIKYKCIIAVQWASCSQNAMELLANIKNIIQTSKNLNEQRDILLFVNITEDIYGIMDEECYIATELMNICPEYLITSSINCGTDIPTYFMMLNYLTLPGITYIVMDGFRLYENEITTADYILKLHTKNDATCINQMTNCFMNGKLEKAISVMDAVPTIDILGGKDLVMPNYHVHDILQPLFTVNGDTSKYQQMQFVAGSAFLSRYQTQLTILSKYPDLIKQALLLCQYVSGWFFYSNSPAHALERIIGGFESLANGKNVKAWI